MKYFLWPLIGMCSAFMCLLNFQFSDADVDVPGMVFFPAGEFMMGNDNGRKDEQPRHNVFLDAFYFDRYETTGKDFEQYLAANPDQHTTITGWESDRTIQSEMAKRPVFGLSWQRCQNYCVWRGKRLPTEAEWERAAGGLENRLYPWGNEPPDSTRANFGKCCNVLAGRIFAEVGTYESGKTPEGVYDMAGNAAEWVYDWYDKSYYQRGEHRNPQGPEKGRYHVIRGGAWNSYPYYMRSTDRYGTNDGQDFYGIGCRCAKSAPDNK